ncbi:MAG: hypothetical protein IPL26_10335 [Leptospiraceae bacterium]|nr:hypothetical protein [Leptospiraceae bacterium]
MILRYFFFILISLLFIAADPVPVEKYKGDISEKEKRVRDYKKEITDVSYSFPQQLKLFYKKTYSDYAVFYDLNGDEVYYRYRRNKFDSDGEKTLTGLFSGQTYRVNGEFAGVARFTDVLNNNILPYPVIYLKNKEDRWWSYDSTEKYDMITADHLKDRNTIPVYRLLSFESTGIDELIY